jgi:hypothetical protein
MLLILLAVATVAAAPDVPTIPPMPADFDVSRTPNLYSRSIPAHCRVGRQQVVDRYGRPVTRRLVDLPGAGPMLLVDRRINGCPVVTMMRGDTREAPDNPNPPPSAYQVMPIRPDKH